MPTHLDARQRDAYIQRTLPTEDLLAVDTHLAVCEACRRQLAAAADTDTAFAALTEELGGDAETAPDHLTFEQLAAYVDGNLTAMQRSAVDAHLTSCGPCVERAERLRVLQGEGNPAPALSASADRAPIWARLRSRLSRQAPAVPDVVGVRPRPVRWGWVLLPAGAVVAAALIFLVITRSRVTDLTRDLKTARSGLARQDTQVRALRDQVATLGQQRDVLQRESQRAAERVRQIAQRRAELEQALADSRRALADSRQALAQRPTPPAGADRPKEERVALRETPLPEVATLSRQDTLMGGPEEAKAFPLRSPVGVVAEGERPVFRWQAVPGAAGYRVSVSEGLDVAREVYAETVSGTEWSPPRPLKRGQTYSWQVIPVRGREEMPGVVSSPVRAWFRVLSAKPADALKRASAADSRSRRDLAVRFANEGVYDRAEEILKALLRDDPTDGAARELLTKIEERRHPRR